MLNIHFHNASTKGVSLSLYIYVVVLLAEHIYIYMHTHICIYIYIAAIGQEELSKFRVQRHLGVLVLEASKGKSFCLAEAEGKASYMYTCT